MHDRTMNLQPDSLWSKIRHRKFLIVFSLPFAGIGLGFLLFGVFPTFYEHQQMQNWALDDARLLSAGVNSYAGDDSTTYRAFATYTYQFRGREYRGDRVAINNMSDNIGDFHQDLGNKLARARSADQPVAVWINPQDPNQAVLNRELRWELLGFQLIFILAFGGAGLGLLLFCLLKPINKISATALQGIDIESKPWLSHRDWANPTIYSDGKSGVWVSWGFSLFWNVIAIPTGIFVFPEIRDGNYMASIALIFPVVGLGLLVWAIRTTLRWRRFGRTPLAMDPYPGSIGGQVGGTLEIGLPYQQETMFQTTLSCLYSYMSGSGDNRRRTERVVWQTEGFATARPFNGNTRVEILFNVDDKLPPSDSQDASSYHLWRLNICAELPGLDFDRNFEIPVFPTALQAKNLRHLSTEHQQAAAHRLQEIEEVLNLQQIPGGIAIYYPAFKKPFTKMMGIFFGVIFFAAGMIAGAEGAPIIFPIVFGLTGGSIALASFYNLIHGLHVQIDQQGLRTAKNVLGIPIGGAQVQRDNIRCLRLKQSYSQSSGRKHTAFFKIQAITKQGKKINIGFNLAGRDVAKQALESLSLLTGLATE